MSQENVPERLKQASMRAPAPVRRWLLRPPYRVYRRLFGHHQHEPIEYDHRGLALPPVSLRRLVGGEKRSSQAWLQTGETDARLIRDLVERNEGPLDQNEAILDFGCGCGRIARWWAELDGPRLFGCDYNPSLTDWCRANLSFMTVKTNGDEPPLPFADDAFDLVCAISVFSHLPEKPQRDWIIELRRVLKPGGLLLFTVHGDRFADSLPGEERERFARGDLVIRSPELIGTNACAAFHPRAYVVQKLLPRTGLELVESVHETPSSVPLPASPLPLQDNYLARKPR